MKVPPAVKRTTLHEPLNQDVIRAVPTTPTAGGDGSRLIMPGEQPADPRGRIVRNGTAQSSAVTSIASVHHSCQAEILDVHETRITSEGPSPGRWWTDAPSTNCGPSRRGQSPVSAGHVASRSPRASAPCA